MAELLVKTPDGKRRRLSLDRRITTVGRDPACDIPVDDPLLPPTALHIHFDGKTYTAACHDGADLLVNGRRRSTCRLSPGDVLRLGSVELHFSPPAGSQETPLPEKPPREHAVHALVRFSRRLLGASDLAGLLDALLDALLEVTHADKGFVIELEDGAMTVKAARNLSQGSVEDAVARVSDSIVQKVVRTRRPLVVADALHDEEWSSSSSVVNLKLCSVMCAPLTARGEVFGVIYLGNDSVVNLFDVKGLETLTIFAAQASLLLQNALLLRDLRRENEVLREAVESRRYGELVGAGASMREVYRRIEKVASTDVTVLLEGETGTGKELVAQEIHRRSPRAKGPFVAVNCAAIPEGLMESELFGHVKGSFTGAVATRPGRFQAAAGGTLLLDEVGEMPPSLQVKLLRALQDRAVVKVGDTRPEAVDIRVVAATNKVLEEEVKKGAFREDLYYRLHVVSIRLPPLRDRGDDVLVLARWFLQRAAREFGSRARGFAPAAVAAMRKYHWPGNIRELENRLKKAAVLADGPLVTAQDLDLRPEELEPAMPLAQALEEYRKRYINEMLERNGGNRTKTAKDLDVDPRTVFRHLEKLEAERRTQGTESQPGPESDT
ncbi:MAG TPA: sigma 54-interacting transcriptional regulator [Anaeromyxobacteraceae bacterium]|nr:sigma 54-interacting transcriptional regulator [Anaeromyxobacteraceae bacterium]